MCVMKPGQEPGPARPWTTLPCVLRETGYECCPKDQAQPGPGPGYRAVTMHSRTLEGTKHVAIADATISPGLSEGESGAPVASSPSSAAHCMALGEAPPNLSES